MNDSRYVAFDDILATTKELYAYALHKCESGNQEDAIKLPSIVTVRTFFIGKPSFGGFGKFSPKTKKARSSFCSERTASERAMYGENCFARFLVGM